MLKQTAGVTCTLSKSLLTVMPKPFIQQTRNTIVLKRKYEVPLTKKGSARPKMTHKHYIYELVENNSIKPKPPLDIILTQYVEGFGEKGEKITLKRNKAYTEFLLPGLAVYASPENVEKYLTFKKEEKSYSSLYVPMTLRTLNTYCLRVNMSIESPWVLEKWHIRVNFRRQGIHVTDDAITMPQKEISGPNLDIQNKEFYITVTINKTEKVNVRCRIHHDTYDLGTVPPTIIDRYTPAEPIFPEDQEVLDSLPKPIPLEKKK